MSVSPVSENPGSAAISENQCQVQLLLMLADDTGWVSELWISKHIEGYSRVSEDSRARYLCADTTALLAAGVPVEVSSSSVGGKVKRPRLNRLRWPQRDPEFTGTKASVVFQTVNATFGSEGLSSMAVAAWRKLAFFMQRSTIAKPGESVVVTGAVDMSRVDFSALLTAMTSPRRTVEMWHSRQYGVDDKLYILEPWGLVNLRGRFYLLGLDPQREVACMFQLSRIRDVSGTGTSATQPMPDGDLQQIAEDVLHRGGKTCQAVVRIAPNTCADVVMKATALGERRYELPAAPVSEIVSTGLSYIPDLIVESPAKARSEIIARLEQVLARHGGSNDTKNTLEGN